MAVSYLIFSDNVVHLLISRSLEKENRKKVFEKDAFFSIKGIRKGNLSNLSNLFVLFYEKKKENEFKRKKKDMKQWNIF